MSSHVRKPDQVITTSALLQPIAGLAHKMSQIDSGGFQRQGIISETGPGDQSPSDSVWLKASSGRLTWQTVQVSIVPAWP
jgi:hypothetical protein